MAKLTERVPQWASASALLIGAMLVGATGTYAYSVTQVVPAPAGCGQTCDAEDADDCPSACTCNDASTTCISRSEAE